MISGDSASARSPVRPYPDLDVRVLNGDAHRAWAAAIVARVNSATGTLEVMLFGKPMVVTYRVGTLSYLIVKTLVHIPFVALPNLSAGRRLLPALLQQVAGLQPRAVAAILSLLNR